MEALQLENGRLRSELRVWQKSYQDLKSEKEQLVQDYQETIERLHQELEVQKKMFQNLAEAKENEIAELRQEFTDPLNGSRLTAHNVAKVLQHICLGTAWWKTQLEYVAYRILGIPRYIHRLKVNCTTDEERLQLMVTFWLHKCPYASWRYLIWALDWEGHHDVANQIHGFAEPLTDPNLNIETLMPLLSSLREVILEYCLQVPHNKIEEIEHQSKRIEGEKRRGLIQWYLNYSPFADSADLAGRLYLFEETSACQQLMGHVQRVPESTLSLSNVTEVFCQVHRPILWYSDGLPQWLNIPSSKTDKMRCLFPSYVSMARQREALLKHYLDCTPFPSWKRVAYAAYKEYQYGALETILQRYLKELNLQKMCEEAVLKFVRTEEDIDSLPLPKRFRCRMKTNVIDTLTFDQDNETYIRAR